MSGAPVPSVHDRVLDQFHFWPSRGIIYVALVFYGLATLAILATTIRTRKWYMLIGAAVGIMEIMGFAFRLASLTKPLYGYYVAMQCLLIISPSFCCLVNYLTLGKVVELARQVNPNISDFLKPKLIAWLYFAAEIFSLALQGAGAGLSTSNNDNNDSAASGKTLLLIGLAFLVAVIICFLTNTVYVNVRKEYGIGSSHNLMAIFGILYTTSVLLLIRNIFRLIEFGGGFYSNLAVHEVYFYVLDSLMVVLILFIFGIFNYGFFLNGFQKEIEGKRAIPLTEMV